MPKIIKKTGKKPNSKSQSQKNKKESINNNDGKSYIREYNTPHSEIKAQNSEINISDLDVSYIPEEKPIVLPKYKLTEKSISKNNSLQFDKLAKNQPLNKKIKNKSGFSGLTLNHKLKNKKLDIVLTFFTGIITISIIVFLLISGVKSIINMFNKDMLNPDIVDDEKVAIEIPPFVEPTDFTKLQPGEMIYAGPIANLAKQDFPDFEKVEDIPDNYLLSFGMWQILVDGGEFTDSYLMEDGTTSIPFEAVVSAVKECFEINRELPEENITVYAPFELKDRHYISDPYGIDAIYFPRVKSVTKENDIVTLICDFINSSDQYAYEENGGDPPAAAKTVAITIKPESDDSYKILSLKTIEQ